MKTILLLLCLTVTGICDDRWDRILPRDLTDYGNEIVPSGFIAAGDSKSFMVGFVWKFGVKPAPDFPVLHIAALEGEVADIPPAELTRSKEEMDRVLQKFEESRMSFWQKYFFNKYHKLQSSGNWLMAATLGYFSYKGALSNNVIKAESEVRMIQAEILQDGQRVHVTGLENSVLKDFPCHDASFKNLSNSTVDCFAGFEF